MSMGEALWGKRGRTATPQLHMACPAFHQRTGAAYGPSHSHRCTIQCEGRSGKPIIVHGQPSVSSPVSLKGILIV